ncbi:hypothetical protein [Paraliomyxa miuraensis]|uniref:hypothetical protein n=1 Tax=Paraliomyxa miuraensis TaxID=376150 RepID=UPI00225515B9|nr:hypothetical protein [Paraliomyxa miuraensis]MCX4240827.1 hypothetical protein [Paraliomyxa miuraensis]
MNASIRFCVRCCEEEIPLQGWPLHALEALARIVGIESGDFNSLHATISERLQSPDPTVASYRNQYDGPGIDALELCVASTLRDRDPFGRVTEIADVIPTGRAREIGAIPLAEVPYTVGRAYVSKRRWRHAAWWMAFAFHDEHCGAHAELVQGIAQIDEDIGSAFRSCEHALEKWVDGLPSISTHLLCRSLALACNDSERASRFWNELEEQLSTPVPGLFDDFTAFNLATVGVALVASGDFEAASEYITKARRAHAEGNGRVLYLMGLLLRELPPDENEPVRELVLKALTASE